MMKLGGVYLPAFGNVANRQLLVKAQAQKFDAFFRLGAKLLGMLGLPLRCLAHEGLRPGSIKQARLGFLGIRHLAQIDVVGSGAQPIPAATSLEMARHVAHDSI